MRTLKNVNLLCFLVVITTGAWGQNLDSGLVIHYPFNGNAKDASPNCYNGRVEGATLDTNRFGVKNQAYFFDGKDDYIMLEHSTETLYVYAVALWFKTSTLYWGPSARTSGILFTGNHAVLNQIGRPTIYLEEDGSLRISGGFGKGKTKEIIATGNHGDNEWHCVVANFIDSSDVMQLYVDGRLIGVDTHYATPLYLEHEYTTDKMVTLGWRDAKNQFYRGSIDDFRLYNRTLTAQEVRMLKHEGSCTNYRKNYTAQFISSDKRYAKEGNKVYLAKTSRLTALGGCDSIINYYHQFTYKAKDCTDSVVFVDTVKMAVTDTLIIPFDQVGVHKNESNLLKVFPNPTTGRLYIQNENNGSLLHHHIKIVSSTGSIVLDQEADKQKFWVDLSHFGGKGLYFLQIFNPEGELLHVRKIALQ